jgi:hypothetical protein
MTKLTKDEALKLIGYSNLQITEIQQLRTHIIDTHKELDCMVKGLTKKCDDYEQERDHNAEICEELQAELERVKEDDDKAVTYDMLLGKVNTLQQHLSRFEKDCEDCEGTGECPDCEGCGYTGYEDKTNKKYSCETCGGDEDHLGDGKCPACENGKVPKVVLPDWFVEMLKLCADDGYCINLDDATVDGKIQTLSVLKWDDEFNEWRQIQSCKLTRIDPEWWECGEVKK